jgi:hypothetical protein
MAMATTVSALALLAPAAAAQVPSIELPAVPDVAAQMPNIPAAAPSAAISDQYQAIAAAVQQAAPAAPAPQPAAAPKPAPVATPAPTAAPKPEADRYHSETTPNVSVTQTQPENVNVSIRINSPGDDGPVVQVTGAGADVVTNVVNQIAGPPDPAAQAPASPPASALPDSWTWVWTSACFGGSGGGAPTAAAATAGWNWQWSCDQDGPPAGAPLPGPDAFPGMSPGDLPGLADVPALADVPLAAAALPEQAVAGESRAHARPERAAAVKQRPPPTGPPPAAGGLLGAGPSPGAIAQPVVALAAHAGRAVRHAVEAQARPARDADSNLPSGAGGPSAGAATAALGAAMSLLLGTWIAVLVCAVALVVPRIWRRRWSGPPWRTPAPRAARLERPG